LILPPPTDFRPFIPPPPPTMTGILEPNAELIQARIAFRGLVHAPETIKQHPRTGDIYCGNEDGYIVRIRDGHAINFSRIDGKPNGFDFTSDGHIIIADASKARLLKLNTDDASVTTLLTHVAGQPLVFPNDVVISRSGVIYFTDSSSRHSFAESALAVLEHQPNGRLMEYNPHSGAGRVLLDNLVFANGVTLSPDEDFLLVVEMGTYSVIRYWLQGQRSGQSEVWASNIPGLPDNIQAAKGPYTGSYWLALVRSRSLLLDVAHPYPRLKQLFSLVPESVRLRLARPYGLVLLLDSNGNIQRSFHDPTGNVVASVTSANQIGRELYLGNIEYSFMNILRLYE